jgi:hypothetical protein
MASLMRLPDRATERVIGQVLAAPRGEHRRNKHHFAFSKLHPQMSGPSRNVPLNPARDHTTVGPEGAYTGCPLHLGRRVRVRPPVPQCPEDDRGHPRTNSRGYGAWKDRLPEANLSPERDGHIRCVHQQCRVLLLCTLLRGWGLPGAPAGSLVQTSPTFLCVSSEEECQG